MDVPNRPEPIDVIIPTMAKAERAACLCDAIDSVLAQRGVAARPLVVVNGPLADPALLARVEASPEIRVLRLEEANLPAAIRAGVQQVRTDWFAELDDDDQLLPDTLAARLALGLRDDSDVVVANGISHGKGEDTLLVEDLDAVAADPLLALTRQNWLSPGTALFRTRRVSGDFFARLPAYLEWTYLAVRLSQECRISFLNEPGLVYCNNSPDALSRSSASRLGQPAALTSILALEVPAPLRRHFEQRMAAACNTAALLEASRGQRAAAWRWHLKCLRSAGGWRYLPFTRKLLTGNGVAEQAT